MRGLNCGDGAVFVAGDLDQLLSGAFVAADVKVVANQQQERLIADAFTTAKNGVAIPKRLLLFDETQSRSGIGGGIRVGLLISRAHNDTDVINAGGKNLFDNDPEHRLGGAIPVHNRLQRKRALALPGGRYDGFSDFHCCRF